MAELIDIETFDRETEIAYNEKLEKERKERDENNRKFIVYCEKRLHVRL